MITERVTVVFSDDAVYVDNVLKRLPIQTLKEQLAHHDAKAIHWHPDTQSGLIEYEQAEPAVFSDPSVVQPYLNEWRIEPEQPEAQALGSYLDAITMGPQDDHIMALKAAWEEVKQRHSVKTIAKRNRNRDSAAAPVENEENDDGQNAKQRVLEQVLRDQTKQLDERLSPHQVREAERLRMLAAAKRKPA